MSLMKLFKTALLVLLALGGPATRAQTPAEIHRSVRQALERRDYRTAIVELERLQKSNGVVFELNNYEYLLARTAEKEGDTAKAAAAYLAVAARNSPLKEYALWHLAQIARASGNLLLERTYLQELAAVAPDSLLAAAVQRRLAGSYFESKNYETAIRLLTNGQPPLAGQTTSSAGGATAPTAPPGPAADSELARRSAALLGEAYLQTGKIAEAREIFARLVNNAPNPGQPDDHALAGARGLDRLEAGGDFGRKAPPLTDYEHLRRAQIYQFNRDFHDARLHFQAIIENHPASGLVPDAIYQIGRCYAQEADYLQAISWFERALEQFPAHPVAKDALGQAASAYSRVGKPKEAVTRYQRLIEKYPDAENLDRAYLNIVDVLRDAGEISDALKQAAKTQEVFRGKLPEAIALFSQLRIRLAQEDWTGALADAEKLLAFADLGGTRVPGGTNRAEITFVKALALENLQRYPEAIDVYLSLPDGRNEYYGWRATEKLRLLTNNEKAKPGVGQKLAELEKIIDSAAAAPDAKRRAAQDALRLEPYVEAREKLLASIRQSYAALPDYRQVPNFRLLEFGRREVLLEKPKAAAERRRALADELLFLGLYDEGTPELERALRGEAEIRKNENPKTRNESPRSDLDYTLAVFYNRGEMANRAVAFAEPLWRAVPADYQVELMPREQVELLYPAPYRDALLSYAPERGVDPRYALSIMRQESRYRADVKSNAAARGLMQFISTTSNQIARELGRENFRQDDLYHPPTAILFGSQYLANIFKMFPGQPAAVAAGYNGGEDNVRRWMLRSKSGEPDRYVPEIVFSQSKDYAYKVMANYRVYRVFYDENLNLREK
jgi:soluble lytic murein transglycosylase